MSAGLLNVGDEAVDHLDQGLYCAESVVMAVARREGIDSPLLPAIATGFCSGLARTAGPCGAVTGAVMALGLALGRSTGEESVDPAYRAVQDLLRRFEKEFGSLNCASLLDCHLGTPEGQRAFKTGQKGRQCAKYTARAAQLAEDILHAVRNEGD